MKELFEICKEVKKKFSIFDEIEEDIKRKKEILKEVKLNSLADVVAYNSFKVFTEINSLYATKFLNIAMDMNCELRARGYGYRVAVFCAYRTLEEQAELWLKGRYVSGQVVTYALPGESLHHYGVAVDFVFWNKNGWSWDNNHPWDLLQKIAMNYGASVYDFDKPHVEFRMQEVLNLRENVVKYIAQRMREAGLDPLKFRKSIPSYLK